jgi:hypothetical protein
VQQIGRLLHIISSNHLRSVPINTALRAIMWPSFGSAELKARDAEVPGLSADGA